MATRVYLGDLRYTTAGILANDCMPLGVAYMKAVMDRDNPDVESRLFAYPDMLLQALKDAPPDVLMLSNYVWNEALSREFFRIAKKLNPGVLTVMGGPNIALEPERQIAYLEAHPEIDVYITGEISEPQAHYARECGVAYIACGHHASERYGAPAVGALVAAQLGLSHQFIDIPNPA